MENLKIGQKVKHKEYGFVGYAEDIKSTFVGEQAIVRITEGKNPIGEKESTYIAYAVNLEEVPEVADDVDTEVGTNGDVMLTLSDGTEVYFEFYADFKDFMERLNQLQK